MAYFKCPYIIEVNIYPDTIINIAFPDVLNIFTSLSHLLVILVSQANTNYIKKEKTKETGTFRIVRTKYIRRTNRKLYTSLIVPDYNWDINVLLDLIDHDEDEANALALL